jgi:hypothetical protein
MRPSVPQVKGVLGVYFAGHGEASADGFILRRRPGASRELGVSAKALVNGLALAL